MTNHTGHGHPATPAARTACRKFMADHDGMDEVTYRVSVREIELDDAFEGDPGYYGGRTDVDIDDDGVVTQWED